MKARLPSTRALLLVDFINPLDFPHDCGFVARAVRAAGRAARLKRTLKRRGWRSSVRTTTSEAGTAILTSSCAGAATAGDRLGSSHGVLRPTPTNTTYRNPRHSAFFGNAARVSAGGGGCEEAVHCRNRRRFPGSGPAERALQAFADDPLNRAPLHPA
jgi:hypothetical protein